MEFVLLWATFVAIMLTDLERGIGIGIIMAVLYFAYSYAQAGIPSTAPPAVTIGANNEADSMPRPVGPRQGTSARKFNCCLSVVLLPVEARGRIRLRKEISEL